MKQFTYKMAIMGAIVLVAYFFLWSMHKASWALYPYPPGADEVQTTLIWARHVLFEKVLTMSTCFLIGFATYLFLTGLKPRVRFVLAVLAAFMLKAALISRYILLFGLQAYFDHNTLESTAMSTFSFSYLGGGLAYLILMWRNRKTEIEQEPSQPLTGP